MLTYVPLQSPPTSELSPTQHSQQSAWPHGGPGQRFTKVEGMAPMTNVIVTVNLIKILTCQSLDVLQAEWGDERTAQMFSFTRWMYGNKATSAQRSNFEKKS